MSRLTQKGATGPIELFQTSTDLSIGTLTGSKFESSDGREFVLVQNGGTALASGVCVQGPPAIANSAGLSPATSSTTGYSASYPIILGIGLKTIQIATGATAFLANQFQGGYMVVQSGTGLGQTFKIQSNTAAATTAASVFTLEDGASVATDSTSRYTLTLNPYGSRFGTDYTTNGVIISPATTLTGMIAGVTLYPIAASTATVAQFGLIQTKGPAAVLGSSTVALGIDVGLPSGTAGAMLAYAVATGPKIGTAMVVTASATNTLVNLKL